MSQKIEFVEIETREGKFCSMERNTTKIKCKFSDYNSYLKINNTSLYLWSYRFYFKQVKQFQNVSLAIIEWTMVTVIGA